jgi:REP element-mobilizing transposase RayT
MEKKEAYRQILPHYQQPGQAYFVTWNLKDAIPPKALSRYSLQLAKLKLQITGAANSDSPKIYCNSEIEAPKNGESEFAAPDPESDKLKREYNLIRRKYIKAYDDLLDSLRKPTIDLSRKEITEIIIRSLQFWEGEKLHNFAFTIMPNHVHWVFELYHVDKDGQPIYLQDVLQSVKRFSSNQINLAVNRKGSLWQKENFDTTIRDEKHLYYAVKYTLYNPVKAGLVTNWSNWAGAWNGYDGCNEL